MLPKRNYYLNDYFDMFNNSNKEKEYMKTDIYEKDSKYILEIDLPGIKKENIKINYDANYLTITAKRNNPNITNNYIRKERPYGEIKRIFYIGAKKESDLKASYTDGVLIISFPKEDITKNNIKNITIS